VALTDFFTYALKVLFSDDTVRCPSTPHQSQSQQVCIRRRKSALCQLTQFSVDSVLVTSATILVQTPTYRNCDLYQLFLVFSLFSVFVVF